MNQIDISQYKANRTTKLSDRSTLEDLNDSKNLKKSLEEVREILGKFQDILYAHSKYGVLVCIQGMDTAGKDSLIREVFKDFNARGVMVHSFKVPTELERKHDYIWRHYIALPPKGKFGVFNRTHYENVIVTRVHPEYILSENIPDIDTVDKVNQKFWDRRFERINNFERHIAENGMIIFKFFLHLSKEEQRQRLLRRLRLKKKHWKFSDADLKERKLWDTYQECYQEAINRTSHPYAPWYVIPADNKKAARVIVASIMLQELKKHKDIREPELDDGIKANLDAYINQLENEKE